MPQNILRYFNAPEPRVELQDDGNNDLGAEDVSRDDRAAGLDHELEDGNQRW